LKTYRPEEIHSTHIGTFKKGINPRAWAFEKAEMDSDHYSDVVGLRIGEWVVRMSRVTTYLLRDVKKNELLREKDIQGNPPRCIHCGKEIGRIETLKPFVIMKVMSVGSLQTSSRFRSDNQCMPYGRIPHRESVVSRGDLVIVGGKVLPHRTTFGGTQEFRREAPAQADNSPSRSPDPRRGKALRNHTGVSIKSYQGENQIQDESAETRCLRRRPYYCLSIFTLAKGGLMYEACIGGQKFSFEPNQLSDRINPEE
jgi:hypothetical protein